MNICALYLLNFFIAEINCWIFFFNNSLVRGNSFLFVQFAHKILFVFSREKNKSNQIKPIFFLYEIPSLYNKKNRIHKHLAIFQVNCTPFTDNGIHFKVCLCFFKIQDKYLLRSVHMVKHLPFSSERLFGKLFQDLHQIIIIFIYLQI